MANHIHLFVRTPKPNLSRGMQYLLSGYANWYAKRLQRTGHLFQGIFKAELVEDESYFWTLSRYVHLNPVRGKRPLVDHPSEWAWSNYPGYCRNKPQHLDQTAQARRLTSLDANQVIATVAAYFKASPSSYQAKRSTAPGRDLAAYIAHRRTTATLRELAIAFGLSHPDSVSNLTRRAEIAISAFKSQKQDLDRIEELLHEQ
jgi:hypothetical protein